jgi:hypothetical protein
MSERDEIVRDEAVNLKTEKPRKVGSKITFSGSVSPTIRNMSDSVTSAIRKKSDSVSSNNEDDYNSCDDETDDRILRMQPKPGFFREQKQVTLKGKLNVLSK